MIGYGDWSRSWSLLVNPVFHHILDVAYKTKILEWICFEIVFTKNFKIHFNTIL